MTTTENIIVYQGADFSRTINLTDANNNPLNVAGYSANATMKIDPYSTNGTIYSFTCILANGQLTLSMWANVSILIPPGYYAYDIILYNGVETYRPTEGICQVDPGVTVS